MGDCVVLCVMFVSVSTAGGWVWFVVVCCFGVLSCCLDCDVGLFRLDWYICGV